MKEDPYTSPSTSPKNIFLRDLPKKERKRLVLSGNTTAGPLAVFLWKHPFYAGAIGVICVFAFFVGCWTCIQM